jgi:Zn-dependent peptidase ImmA (M78 family)
MPRGDVLGHVPPPSTITVKTIHKLKKRWGVSAIALVYRLHKLEIITDWQYRNLCIGLSSDGYKSGEADGARRDTSQVLAKVFSKLRDQGITRGTIARELRLTPTLIDSLLVGLVIASVSSSEGATEPKSSSTAPRAKLRAV